MQPLSIIKMNVKITLSVSLSLSFWFKKEFGTHQWYRKYTLPVAGPDEHELGWTNEQTWPFAAISNHGIKLSKLAFSAKKERIKKKKKGKKERKITTVINKIDKYTDP